LFQQFRVVVNNMRANADVIPYDDHDRVVSSYMRCIVPCGMERSRPFLSLINTPL
jgi:hypothetical protein